MSLLGERLEDELDNIIQINQIIKFINDYCYADIIGDVGLNFINDIHEYFDVNKSGLYELEIVGTSFPIEQYFIDKYWVSYIDRRGMSKELRSQSYITIHYVDTFLIENYREDLTLKCLNKISKYQIEDHNGKVPPILIHEYPHKTLPDYIKFDSECKEILCINCNKDLIIPGYEVLHTDFDPHIKQYVSKDSFANWIKRDFFNYGII